MGKCKGCGGGRRRASNGLTPSLAANMKGSEDVNTSEIPVDLVDSASLPMIVVLPVRIVNATGVQRHYVIRHANQPVPAAVREFMAGDRRFAKFLKESAPAKAADDQVYADLVADDATGSGEAPVPEEKPVAPTEEKALVIADDEKWSAKSSGPVLRAWGKRHDFEIAEGSDIERDDIAELLRDAFPQYELVE